MPDHPDAADWLLMTAIGLPGAVSAAAAVVLTVCSLIYGPLWALAAVPLFALMAAAAAWMVMDVWRG